MDAPGWRLVQVRKYTVLISRVRKSLGQKEQNQKIVFKKDQIVWSEKL